MSFPDGIENSLGKAGINASALDRIRLARGVVGKSSYVAAVAIGALAVVAWGFVTPTLYSPLAGSLRFYFAPISAELFGSLTDIQVKHCWRGPN